MSQDWKDALRSLSHDLPSDEAAPELVPSDDSQVKFNPRKLHISYERKGRGGKEATIISGFESMTDAQIKQIASEIKRKLAVGGSARGGEILLQGDCRDALRHYFEVNIKH